MVSLRGSLSVYLLATLVTAGVASGQMTLNGFALGANTVSLRVNVTPYLAGPVDSTIGMGPAFETFSADLGHPQLLNEPESYTVQNTQAISAPFQEAARLLNAFEASAGTNPLKNGALQEAIWSVLYPTYTFSDYGTPGVSAQAEIYLSTDLSNYSDAANYYNFGGKNMNQIGPAAVPEPGPFAGIAGALGFFALKRRGGRRDRGARLG